MTDKETRVTEKTRIDYTELIRDLNGFDDVFFNVLLQGNPDTRQFLKNIYGNSIRMDCYAEWLHKIFNVEIQRRSAGAGAERARLNSSLLDADAGKSGEDAENLYVIFITEHDVYEVGKPYYEIERVVKTTGAERRDRIFCM